MRPVDSASDAVPLQMDVTVEAPTPEKIVVTKERFTPTVKVTVETAMPSAGDALSEVTVAVVNRVTKMRFASTKLNQTRLETMPGGRFVYRFGDTPVDVAPLASGDYDLVVAARTAGGAQAETTVPIAIDAGPMIRLDQPGEGKSFRLSARVSAMVTDERFGPVKSVSMSVGQRPLALTASDDAYSATIEFDKYDPPLEGEQLLTVRAVNRNGTESVTIRKFLADHKGPLITNTSPRTGALIGKVITISADVTDSAGVLESSVVAVVAHGDKTYEVKLDPPAVGATTATYRKLFDTTRLPVNALFPSISFRASDVLGNQSSIGYLLSLDNTPPLAELDPPNDLRVVSPGDNGPSCSWPFDPVGPDAVDDGDLVSQLFDLRARVEDQGNDAVSGTVDFTPIAGIDEEKAQLLILDDTTQPLVVDTNGDGFCDEVNPTLKPTTAPMSARDALLINLVPVPPAGAVDTTFEPGSACSGFAAKIPEVPCTTTYNAAKARWPRQVVHRNIIVPFLPHSDGMPFYLPYSTSRSAAIWTVPPIVDDRLQCVGRQFDAFANNMRDGWACLAVAAADKLGNAQVSKVLRVCLDHDGKGGECPHLPIVRVSFDTPMILETATPHGFATGAQVVVSGVQTQTGANGRFPIRVLDDRRFELVGSSAHVPRYCHDQDGDSSLTCNSTTVVDGSNRVLSVSNGAGQVVIETADPHGLVDSIDAVDPKKPAKPVYMTGIVDQVELNGSWNIVVLDDTRFALVGSAGRKAPVSGRVVNAATLPDCTGTQTAKMPAPVITNQACKPWRVYRPGEYRRVL